MFHHNVLQVFIMLYCLCSINSLALDCNQYSNDLDVLRQFPFTVQLNLNMNHYYSHQKSAAQLSEDGTFAERIAIKNENLVPSSVFCLSNLTILNMESTPFENDIVPDALANPKTLKYLMIHFVPINEITNQLSALTNLEAITFFQCSLTHLSGLNNLHHLKMLNLSYNSLTQIDAISNASLDTLDIMGNNLTEIPILKNKEHLTFLLSSYNPLKNAESIIFYPNLRHIYLQNARLKSIPSAIDKL